MKYCKGDKIILKTKGELVNEYGFTSYGDIATSIYIFDDMQKVLGKMVTIEIFDEDDGDFLCKENGYWYTGECIKGRALKVGDKVKLKSVEKMKEEFGINKKGYIDSYIPILYDMRELLGKVVTVNYVDEEDGGSFKCNESTFYYGFDAIEEVLNDVDKAEDKFSLSDIKDGMVVEFNDKDFGKYYLKLGDKFLSESGYMEVSKYDDNLKIIPRDYEDKEDDFDIIAVYTVKNPYDINCYFDLENLECVWRRKTKMTISEMQKLIKEKLDIDVEIV